MMVATLIATITFQVGLNSSEGFVSDNRHENPTKENSKADIGQVIVQGEFNYFLVFDMLGLLAI